MKKIITLLSLLMTFNFCLADEKTEELMKKVAQLLTKNELVVSDTYNISFRKDENNKINLSGVAINGGSEKVIDEKIKKSLIKLFSQPITIVNQGKWGISDGSNIISAKYDFPVNFTYKIPFSLKHKKSKLAVVSINDKYGYVNNKGEEIIPLQFDSASDFIEGYAAVKKNGKWGFINEMGNNITGFEYDDVNDFSEGLAYTEKEGNKGFIDKTGILVIPIQYDSATKFQQGLATIIKNEKQGLINRQGELIIPPKYSLIYPFENDLAVALNNDNKFGFIDKTGEVIIPFVYDRAMSFYGNASAVMKDGKWGFIDKKGTIVLPLKYDNPIFGSDDMYLISKNRKYGFANANGKIIIEPQYIMAEPFKNGFAKVYDDAFKSHLINIKGKIVHSFSN